VTSYSFDPSTLPGNVESFVGVAQVPIGLAGPLLVNGEHARGEFYVSLATAEGTLVASYNRGMKLLRQAGGVTTTILDDPTGRSGQRCAVSLKLRSSQRPSVSTTSRVIEPLSAWTNANGRLPVA
jgi:hydroxymethylglutaryl-CoA reductase